ncbi:MULTISPECIES: M20 aminoacylase family protein [Campylobacter]|uniref:Amidohydrolase n=1 Tax=Campylobacter molothri TaxID=1032242 RepID=A0ACC5W0F7_9BACT|nr:MULTISPECIES: M20 aminoacylase family protein [unclassified Campylobacter]MBZ7931321.1 amidohydrolase [Campylobacter sp. RM12910]MBZ7933289.1 amidohydrolase [Campylobacter sp. RM10543]MBZ7949272.1 amidohydrolase [Campylobacter sp. RM10534]MBZ7957819.1 amidohydrolase [Campylobacter sp. RM9760]MBZ7965115.1 amidohydrolase [Campylobacter sp. RM10535]MBZ7969920.1 amidohydrolase [Campylobacter sp. RM3125]MBZ7971488.1 amidohydrolase [Campylobacter sp. RM3124]MBZ7973955.1 amidohydrolase [Campylo
MKLIPEIVDLKDEFVKIRHQIHENPELGFDEIQTARLVAKKLKDFGYEVYEGIGKTGVVGVLKKGNNDKKIGLRADMDALPMQECAQVDYKSKKENIMHACGHDGHTSSLLLAAKYLAKQEFNGTLNLYFQPAEEGLGGANEMIKDGLFEKFDSDFIFGWHNMPFGSSKKFYLKKGAMMASSDSYTLEVIGKGGHGSAPEKTKDPIYVASLLVIALQSIVSRNVAPQNSAVVSIGSFNSGYAFNIIPDNAVLKVSIRSLDNETRKLTEEKLHKICQGIADANDVEIKISKEIIAPITINNDEAVEFASEVAKEIFGEENCEFNHQPLMGSEDFGFFCEMRKCAYAFLENENDIYLHNSHYIFNDELLPRAASYYASLVLKYLK